MRDCPKCGSLCWVREWGDTWRCDLCGFLINRVTGEPAAPASYRDIARRVRSLPADDGWSPQAYRTTRFIEKTLPKMAFWFVVIAVIVLRLV